MSDRKVQLEQNLSATRAEIERLAAQSGRKPPQLLPVTKFHPAASRSGVCCAENCPGSLV